jgi:hypothetical protein
LPEIIGEPRLPLPEHGSGSASLFRSPPSLPLSLPFTTTIDFIRVKEAPQGRRHLSEQREVTRSERGEREPSNAATKNSRRRRCMCCLRSSPPPIPLPKDETRPESPPLHRSAFNLGFLNPITSNPPAIVDEKQKRTKGDVDRGVEETSPEVGAAGGAPGFHLELSLSSLSKNTHLCVFGFV